MINKLMSAMSQSDRLLNMVDTISHFFSIKKGMREYRIINSPAGPTHQEITRSPSLPAESTLKLSSVLNYVKVANDGSVSNASSSDAIIATPDP